MTALCVYLGGALVLALLSYGAYRLNRWMHKRPATSPRVIRSLWSFYRE